MLPASELSAARACGSLLSSNLTNWSRSARIDRSSDNACSRAILPSSRALRRLLSLSWYSLLAFLRCRTSAARPSRSALSLRNFSKESSGWSLVRARSLAHSARACCSSVWVACSCKVSLRAEASADLSPRWASSREKRSESRALRSFCRSKFSCCEVDSACSRATRSSSRVEPCLWTSLRSSARLASSIISKAATRPCHSA
mmetsp:Transcript_10645/g.23954  ORF Transcript_10645/g.23954 Transcript_10645/m.23954 type:complete len:202 (-) Transcript_10645:1307-1912(-)